MWLNYLQQWEFRTIQLNSTTHSPVSVVRHTLCQLIFSHLFPIQQVKPACPQSQGGDAGGTKQSFIADPIPVQIQCVWKLLKLPTIHNEVSFTQITPNAD